MSNQNITSVLKETRSFPPSAEFSAAAHITSAEQAEALRERAKNDPDGFWGEQAESLHWMKKWHTVLDWSNAPHAKWFVGGQLNVSDNCLDRHLNSWRKNKAAIIWEGEPGDTRTLTYQQLYR
jgi:acetyl-CoA synthetase